MEAINLYMKAGLPARAARLALNDDVSTNETVRCFYMVPITYSSHYFRVIKPKKC